MKVAFDVHGVLDTLPEYRELMRTMFDYGHEIFIISGQPYDAEMVELLEKHDLIDWFHTYDSVETYLLDTGEFEYEIVDDGKFWPDHIWDPVKAKICEEHGIDMIFDNSPSYAAEFKKVATHFNLVIDKTKSLTDKRK